MCRMADIKRCDIFKRIGFVFIPPYNAKTNKETGPFDEIHNQIEIKLAMGRVRISGDLNTRKVELRYINKIDFLSFYPAVPWQTHQW